MIRRLVLAAAALTLPIAAQETTAPSAPQPPTLRDLRQDVATGRLKSAPELCDLLAKDYEDQRAAALAAASQGDQQEARQAPVDLFMACYCRYAKAQVLAELGKAQAADQALADARAFRTRFPEFANPRLAPLWQEIDAVTAGYNLEKAGKTEAAVQTYLAATTGAGGGSAKATARLAMIEWRRGHADKARSWAFIHADDPTCQYVLAQLALKTPAIAQRHLGQAITLIQKQLAGGNEYMPIYFAEGPAIVALHRKLPPLPPTPKPAPKVAPKPAPPPPAN